MIDFLQTTWPTLTLVAGLTALFLLLRNRPTPVDNLDSVVKNGQPTVVEIFSNM